MWHDLALLTDTREADEEGTEDLIAGTTYFKIEAFGTAEIMITNQGQKTPQQLLEVAYEPGFMANLALIIGKDRSVICECSVCISSSY